MKERFALISNFF